MTQEHLAEILEGLKDWTAHEVPQDIGHGDMPGDRIKIGEEHLRKSAVIFPLLTEEMRKLGKLRIVVSVFGGSGVGKSEIASLLGHYLREAGIGAYVLSGDNYPRRIPLYNDAERLSVFRANGLKGLIRDGEYGPGVQEELHMLWVAETDPDPKLRGDHPWLETYQTAGRAALKQYLGTELEQDYDEINGILRAFHDGADRIWLKRMGRTEEQRWYDEIDFSGIQVLIIEWTHGGNDRLEGIDIPILLNSTPEETREHRRLRARDGKTDSAFTTMVLEVEQEELQAAAKKAKIILSKAGERMDPSDFE